MGERMKYTISSDNAGIEEFPTLEAAIAEAHEYLETYRAESAKEGWFSEEVDHLRVMVDGVVTHKLVQINLTKQDAFDEDGVEPEFAYTCDYELRLVKE